MSPLHKPMITVIGSINLDLVVTSENLPRPGETLIANSIEEFPGGKGANQAVAASRLLRRDSRDSSEHVTMVGRVGNDSFGTRLLENLNAGNIDTRFVSVTEASSGIAIVAVESSGQNAITILPGANGMLSPDDVDAARDTIRDSAIVLLQLEIPIETVLHAIAICKEVGTRVMLDPAPAPQRLESRLFQVDFICPNEVEAAAITRIPVASDEEVTKATNRIHELGARNVIITLGKRGACLRDESGNHLFVKSPEIVAIDTTAAGDAFAGAFASQFATGGSLEEAVRFGCAAGAIAASRKGAQIAMPRREEVERRVAEGT